MTPTTGTRSMIDGMRLNTERITRFDVVLVIVLSVVSLPMLIEDITADATHASPAIIPAFFLVTGSLLWRRAAPIAAAAFVFAASGIHVLAFGVQTRCGIEIPTAALLAYAAAARVDWQESLIVVAIALATLVVVLSSDQDVGLEGLAIAAPLVVVSWVGGRIVQARGRLAAELELRNSELRHARDQRARLEVAADRAQLSAELDELLRRRLAELARIADDADPATAATTLAAIERESRQTLEQMRAVVGVLRHDDGSPTAPLPTLTALEALLIQAKGSSARLSIDGDPRTLPAGVELSAYRVVEHLLDALTDAPGIAVRVGFDDQALTIAVGGPARRRQEAERSIERARERVALHRGTLEATFRSGHADTVALLPVT